MKRQLLPLLSAIALALAVVPGVAAEDVSCGSEGYVEQNACTHQAFCALVPGITLNLPNATKTATSVCVAITISSSDMGSSTPAGLNGIYFVTSTATSTATVSTVIPATDTLTATATLSGTAPTSGYTSTETGTITAANENTSTRTTTDTGTSSTTYTAQNQTVSMISSSVSTYTFTGLVTASAIGTTTGTATGTVTGNVTVTRTSTISMAMLATVTASSVLRTTVKTSTGTGTISDIWAYSGRTLTGTGTRTYTTENSTDTGTRTATGTITAISTSSGTATQTLTTSGTTTSSSTAATIAIGYDKNYADVPKGDKFYRDDGEGSFEWFNFPPIVGVYPPSADSCLTIPAPATVQFTDMDGWRRLVNGASVAWIPPGKIRFYPYVMATVGAGLSITVDVCDSSGPTGNYTASVTTYEIPGATWTTEQIILPLPTGGPLGGVALAASEDLCVSIATYAFSGSPYVCFGMSGAHPSRINGDW